MQNLVSEEFVLDASAFYTGIPFLSCTKYYTTSLVFNEIKHINKSYSVVELLKDIGDLKVIEPEKQILENVNTIAKKTGDSAKLSSADISIIALALQLKKILISDDYAILNIARLLNIPVKTLTTKGITNVRKWITYCYTCGKAFDPNIRECLLCGNRLRRRYKKIVR